MRTMLTAHKNDDGEDCECDDRGGGDDDDDDDDEDDGADDCDARLLVCCWFGCLQSAGILNGFAPGMFATAGRHWRY